MSEVGLRGCGTALVTPFDTAGELDEAALRALVDWQIEQGVHFLVPCGSTGEAATLSREEHLRVVSIVAEQADGRVPVVAGAGGNDTREAVDFTGLVAAAGATHVLHVSPAYNRPPQRGIVAHFTTIADSAPVPLVLYNVPGRTASNMAAETTLELAEHPNVMAVKEASGDPDQVAEILRNRPPGFSVLSGDDSHTLPLMALGADGVISVVSNIVPAAIARLVDVCHAGDYSAARSLQYELLPLMKQAFVETNPMPVKFALAHSGRIQNHLRLPLVPLGPEYHSGVIAALSAAEAAS